MKISIKAGNKIEEAFLSYENNIIAFQYNNIHIIKEEDRPFIALKLLRQELEPLEIKLLINGSRLNVYPSGMSLITMGVYVLQLGKSATHDNMVHIFDNFHDITQIVSIADQEAYLKKWLDSLKK